MTLTTLRHAGMVALAAVAIGVGLPAGVAVACGVFDKRGLREHLPPSAAKELREFEAAQNGRKKQLDGLDAAIRARTEGTAQPAGPPQAADALPGLLLARDALRKEAEAARSPVVLSPYADAQSMALWPIVYTFLGWLVVLASPPKPKRPPYLEGRTFAIALTLFVLYHWPSWLRNTIWTDDRRVYADVNLDVSWPSWLVQEFMTLLVFYLVAISWRHWADYADGCKSDGATNDRDTDALDSQRLKGLSDTFVRWQVASVLLAGGFIGYTYWAWVAVVHSHDPRYLPSAVAIHLIWGVSWGLISLPLLYQWYDWSAARNRAVAATATAADVHVGELRLRVLQELRPIPAWSLVGSSLTAVTAFALPLLQPLLK